MEFNYLESLSMLIILLMLSCPVTFGINLLRFMGHFELGTKRDDPNIPKDTIKFRIYLFILFILAVILSIDSGYNKDHYVYSTSLVFLFCTLPCLLCCIPYLNMLAYNYLELLGYIIFYPTGVKGK